MRPLPGLRKLPDRTHRTGRARRDVTSEVIRKCARAFLRRLLLNDDELVSAETKHLPDAGDGFVERFAGSLQRFTPCGVPELAVNTL